MTSTTDPIEHQIVAGSDGSDGALAALEWAGRYAERTGDAVVVLRSSRVPTLDGAAWVAVDEEPRDAESPAERELRATLVDLAARYPGVTWRGRVEPGTASDVLVAAAEEGHLVVVGHRGRDGFPGLLLGSTARKVAGGSETTVVVVRGDEQPDGAVVVGVDGTETSRTALAWAAEEARRRSAKLHVVLAWSYLMPQGEHGPMPFSVDYGSEDADRALAAICAAVLGEDPDLDVRREATCELAAKALVERAEGAALLVVGIGDRSLRHRPDLGSVGAQLLHHSPCPLAIVRAPEGPADRGPT